MTLAGLALAIARIARRRIAVGRGASAAPSPATQALAMQNQLNFTRENEYEADRIGFQRLDAAGFDVTRWRRSWTRLQTREPVRRNGNAPSYLRTHPVTLRADRRSAGARVRQALPAGGGLARLPPGARAVAQLPGRRAKEAVAFFDNALAERKFNNEVGDALRARRIAVARQGVSRARRSSSSQLEKMAPPHPMIEAMAGHVLHGQRRRASGNRPLRVGARALPEQDAARLRLPGSADEGRAPRARPRRSARSELARFPDRRPAASHRRARVCGAGQAAAAASAPGRVLRLARQSARARSTSSSWRPRRATATSTSYR